MGSSWPIFGVPTCIVVDSSLEHFQPSLKELCSEMGLSLCIDREPKQPGDESAPTNKE